MQLLTYKRAGKQRLSIRTEKGILDVAAAKARMGMIDVPEDVMDVIEGGAEAVGSLRRLAERFEGAGGADAGGTGAAGDVQDAYVQESELVYEPCVTRPNKIICIGLNYRAHAEETGAAIPDVPVVFSKFNNALTGHLAEIVIPAATNKLDYEAELAIVIGKTARNVSEEDALDYVFGYCCANDLSARDLQKRTSQWLIGKSCDGFAPLGPCLVTADEVVDPNALAIRTIVNGEVRQESNTSDMIFSCAEIVSFLSRHLTLTPGDVILTGTPAGVVFGYPEEKQVYLQEGDTVTVEIERLGRLTNQFVRERA